MKISVIVPTYKPLAYLWECLDSIYNQSFSKSDYELVLVLNGCNEPYNAQINEWLTKHSDLQVQYFQIDEGGVSNARNMALDVAKGEYITFIDDDDYVSPSYLEEMYSMTDGETIICAKPIAFIDKTGEKVNYRIENEYLRHAPKGRQKASKVRKFFSGPCMKLIPMNFMQGRRFDVRFKNGEDSLYMFLISDRFKDVVFTTESAIYYRRIRENSATTIYRSKWQIIKNTLMWMDAVIRIYIKRPWSYNFNFFITRIMASMHSIIEDSMNVARK